jgi:AcrR family transcriptional regulator
VDIAAEANAAAGSFYTYFTNKEEIFAAVLEEVHEEMLHPHVRGWPTARIRLGS